MFFVCRESYLCKSRQIPVKLDPDSRYIEIDDCEDERLRPYCNLRERTLRGESIFVAEGDLVVERLLLSPYEVDSLMITRKQGLERILALVPDHVPVYYVEEIEALKKLVGFEFCMGVMAVGRRRPLPTAVEGFERFFNGTTRRSSDVTGAWKTGTRRAWVVLPDATKPDNLGLAFRCGAALDAEAIVLGEQCCDPFSRRALRVSMGGVLQTPVYKAKNLRYEIEEIRKRWHVPFLATVLNDSAISSYEVKEKLGSCANGVAFVFGNEYTGLSKEMIQICDHSVKIPMRGDVDSLNLGVSVGIFLYEFNRQ